MTAVPPAPAPAAPVSPAQTSPSWTQPAFWAHVFTVALAVAAAVLSFVYAGSHSIPGWLPALVTPVAVVAGVVSHAIYDAAKAGWGKAGFTAAERFLTANLVTLLPALKSLASTAETLRGVPDRLSSLEDTVKASAGSVAAVPSARLAPSPGTAASSTATVHRSQSSANWLIPVSPVSVIPVSPVGVPHDQAEATEAKDPKNRSAYATEPATIDVAKPVAVPPPEPKPAATVEPPATEAVKARRFHPARKK